MKPLRILRCICGTFQSEIDMGDFTKQIALTLFRGKSHSRGEAIITKSGILLGYNIDIERKVAFENPYIPTNKSRKKWQLQVDVVFSNPDETQLALIEYESTDLIEDTLYDKIAKWKCFYPNPQISLLCVIIINLYKEKLEQSWELKDRTKLVEICRNSLKELSKTYSGNTFSIISLNDVSLISYFFTKGTEQIQKYKTNWR